MPRYRLKGPGKLYPWGCCSFRMVLPSGVLELEPGGTYLIVGSVNSNYRNSDLSRWTGAERIGIEAPCDRNISIPMGDLEETS